MNKSYPVIVIAVLMILIESCSKKTHPSPAVINTPAANTPAGINTDPKSDTIAAVKKVDSSVAIKPVAVKKKAAESTPKVITVNDKYASKSVDGRLFYDLQGHRYWRSNKDGKYYLFNKSMLTDDDFKKQ